LHHFLLNLFGLGNGVAENLEKQQDKQLLSEEKQIFQINKEIKDLIKTLETKEDKFGETKDEA